MTRLDFRSEIPYITITRNEPYEVVIVAYLCMALPMRIIISRTASGYKVTTEYQKGIPFTTVRVVKYKPDLEAVADSYRKCWPRATVLVERR